MNYQVLEQQITVIDSDGYEELVNVKFHRVDVTTDEDKIRKYKNLLISVNLSGLEINVIDDKFINPFDKRIYRIK